MLKKVIGLLLPLALIVIGIQFTRDYFGDNGAELKQKYEQLIAEGATTRADLADQYKETTIKIAGLPIKLYEVEYTFDVLGDEFSGTKSLKSPPIQAQMEVTYLPSDPDVNAINPQQELANVKDYENSSSTLYIGLALLLVGLLIGYNRVRAFQQPKTELTATTETATMGKAAKTTSVKKESKTDTAEKTDLKGKISKDHKEFLEDLKKEKVFKKDFESSDHSKFMPK